MLVIGVAGQARFGKDLLADRLQLKLNEAGGEWDRTAFAANVKKVFCETFGTDFDFIEEWKVREECPPGYTMTVRKALQFIGDGFRKIFPMIWIDLVFRNKEKPIIISDVRYINEFTRVNSEGGLNILVVRPDFFNDDKNGSEAEIKPFALWCYFYSRCEPNRTKRFFDLKSLDLPHLRALHGDDSFLYPPLGIEKFDAFIVNESDKESFLQDIDTEVVDYVRSFKFDGKNKEDECLT